MEYSKRLGTISPEQFQAALKRLDLGDFVCAAPVPFGLFGQNIFLTSTKGEFVLRGVPHYPWQFPTERFFVDELHAHALVPVAFPYLLEPMTDIFGWSFVIMPRLPGVQVQDPQTAGQLSYSDRNAIARALARMLVEVQRLTRPEAGQFDLESGSIKPFDKPYRDWIIDRIREKMTAARSYNNHTTSADIEWTEDIISGAQPVRNAPFMACAVLGDYGEHNSVFVRTTDDWQVSGVFDLMTAHFGDGQADLSLSVTHYLRQSKTLADAFVQEYLEHTLMPPGFALLQQLYMVDLMSSFWRHWQRNEGHIPSMPEALTFEEYARPSVDYWKRRT